MPDFNIDPRIYCAIDTPDVARAATLAQGINKLGLGLKLGLEFFSAAGPDGVRQVQAAAAACPLFLDLKYHDIPNTVAAAVRAAARLGPKIINVHATGGPAMMAAAADAARQGAAESGHPAPWVIAVTVLTSLETDDIKRMGVNGDITEQVVRLATLAQESGLDGVVCSAHEITPIRQALGPNFLLVTPGIRPAGADVGDQKRVMTPADAIGAGADILVIGRPITAAADPAVAAQDILADIQNARR